MIRAKDLEKRLPAGMLRREPGKKGRYQLVLRNLDAGEVLQLIDPLWEVFGAQRHCKAETTSSGTHWGVHVVGRAAIGYRDGVPFAEGKWSWRDGQLNLYYGSEHTRVPDAVTQELEGQIKKALRWKSAPHIETEE
jgi:hypothetical protein